MSDPRKADSGAGQEPEDVAFRQAREQIMGAPCKCPDEPEQDASACAVCTTAILTRLVRAGQRRELEAALLHAQGMAAEARGYMMARLALLREE